MRPLITIKKKRKAKEFLEHQEPKYRFKWIKKIKGFKKIHRKTGVESPGTIHGIEAPRSMYPPRGSPKEERPKKSDEAWVRPDYDDTSIGQLKEAYDTALKTTQT